MMASFAAENRKQTKFEPVMDGLYECVVSRQIQDASCLVGTCVVDQIWLRLPKTMGILKNVKTSLPLIKS